MKVGYDVAIDAYIEFRSRGWSINTQRVEAARLRSILPLLDKYGLDPESIYQDLVKQGQAPYTIKTAFVRLKAMLDFCTKFDLIITKGKRDTESRINPFEVYMTYTAPNRFKAANVYKPRVSPLSYDEIKFGILNENAFDINTKKTLMFLLSSGLRIHEVYKLEQSLSGNWFVKGKGGKIRMVFATPPKKYELISRSQVVRALTKLRLTPSHLRKVFATQLAKSGLPAHELKTIMGWSSIVTAQSYLQETSDSELQDKISKVL